MASADKLFLFVVVTTLCPLCIDCICNRLDMHTSGIVMFLKKKEHCAQISDAFREGRVTKKYLCIVDVLNVQSESPCHFTVTEPIERHPSVGFQRQLGRTSSRAQEAETNFTVASTSRDGKLALLSVAPVTGRTHQIRLHAQYSGMPIVGDEVYGRERECYLSMDHVQGSAQDPATTLYLDQNPLRAGLKLHAWQLSIDHPVTGERLNFCASPPQRFHELASAAGLSVPSAG